MELHWCSDSSIILLIIIIIISSIGGSSSGIGNDGSSGSSDSGGSDGIQAQKEKESVGIFYMEWNERKGNEMKWIIFDSYLHWYWLLWHNYA